ncbi:alpha/beta fold hydrolase [Aquabacterium sp. J223]|uniref:alpha/beta fold hydrolase n=1 Tax=Aquabacterium sp. J223 TaxID=2898431 RepID=UPI0021AD7DE6|nr:alpha/beta hydrolase [Aquabacterium sp. J223]UUX97877.1 alpha/beta hydrolase [Aquabacterium sp. J223]
MPPTPPPPTRAERPVLLLLPGLLCDEQVWAQQREALGAAVDCRVPDWGLRASLTDMAEQVLSMAPAGGFSLAGHSMGGRVALEVVRLAPQRVQRLMLMDTGVDPLPEGEAGVQERDKRLALLAIAREHGMRAMGAEWARGMVHPSRLDGPLFAEILAMIERRSPPQFEAQINALLARPDARGVLAGVRCPTVLLCGRQDAWSPLARHEEMQRLLPASRLAVIEDSGHMSTMEQPAAVTQALRAWMETAT